MPFDDDKLNDLRAIALDEIGDNASARTAAEAAFDAYDEALGEAQEKVREFEVNEEEGGDVEDAAHKVCDALERPVGKRTFNVVRPEEFSAAVIGLHDAIGRNI
jgi:hypothetical protein